MVSREVVVKEKDHADANTGSSTKQQHVSFNWATPNDRAENDCQ